MSPTAQHHSMNPAEAIAVFSHNLFNDVSCIAGLVHLLDLTRQADADGPAFCEYLNQLAARSERLVERLQHGVLGLAPETSPGDAPPRSR